MAKGKQTENEYIPKHGSKPLTPAKTKLFAISMVLSVVIMSAMIFVPKWKMDDTRAAVQDNLQAQYGEEFEITWSTLNDHPFSTTFEGTVQSVNTGYVYEFKSEETETTIDYDRVQKEMDMNKQVEAAIEGGISLVNFEDDKAIVRVLLETTDAPADEAAIAQVAASLKEQYNLATLEVNIYEIVDRAFEAAELQMTIFQRSLIPMDSFDTYEPVVKSYTF